MGGKKFVKFPKKRAFTLVEILMVVLISGILVGMMLLSATNAADSAKAARIISDIKTMRSVAVLYKSDNGDWPVWVYETASGKYSAIPPTKGLPLRVQRSYYRRGRILGRSNEGQGRCGIFCRLCRRLGYRRQEDTGKKGV